MAKMAGHRKRRVLVRDLGLDSARIRIGGWRTTAAEKKEEAEYRRRNAV